MKSILAILILFAIAACNKKVVFDGPNYYADDFEAYDSISQLIDGDNRNWSFFQKTRDENSISVDTAIVHNGRKSIRFYALPSNRELGASKASINKQFMAFWEGDIVSVSAWFYLKGTEDANWIFLFDLEEKTAIGAGPGMRLALEDNYLLVEHKFPNTDVRQDRETRIPFPRDQWVHVRFESALSQKNKGYVKVWQDGKMILEEYNRTTLPSDILYSLQGSKGMYSQIEFGITANTHDNPMTIYVDDLVVERLN